ncbi:TetR/AcrR family transcriptional regulator [Hamadaea sp. NPDC051192]|uniref:TetR/AcrR family transcriptional regulator n=1 Tax=Hamadaea sp. NPDC051192 TaxID=3154940 RepID=UPI0034469AFF
MATNRRERQREATKQEIRDAARAQLTEGGPGAISLRAIARDMGLTAAALYRYYDSLDALVEDLCADRYDALTTEVLAARDIGATPLDQLREACRAYRRWALRNPHEYALICGEPVIDTMHTHVEPTPKGDAAMRFTLAFLEPFTAIWHARTTPPQPLVPGVAEALSGPNVEALRQALPIEGVAFFLIGWTRLAGAITMEIFGHLRWATDDVEPLFEQNLEDMLRQLTM